MTRALHKSRIRIALVGAVSVAAMTLGGPPAAAWVTTHAAWQTDQSGGYCGLGAGHVPYTHVQCNVRFVYTGTVSALGWDGATRGGAGAWCAGLDSDFNNQIDFCWEDYTNRGGLGTPGGANVDAVDLGGRSPQTGIISLANTSWSYNYVPASDIARMVYTRTRINTNALLTSASLNENASCRGNYPEWWWGSDTFSSCRYDMEETIAHELGHALGLDHPQKGPYGTSVVQCVQALGESSKVQTDDLNGVRYLYGRRDSAKYGSSATAPC